MKIVAISDIHGRWDEVIIPPCDLLISAGDYSFQGEFHEVINFHRWLEKQPATHIISVQGNHEVGVEKDFNYAKALAIEACPRVHFLDEGLVEIEGKKIWCSAVTPFFCDWAWNKHVWELKDYWERIPDNLDGIVTHGPPKGILDEVLQYVYNSPEPEKINVGCYYLYEKIIKIKPKFHIFGHIHPAYGQMVEQNIRFINAALVNDRYKIANKPIEFEL